MPKLVISQGLIDEMTLVGDGFAPRNPKAKALAVKAAAVQSPITATETTAVEPTVYVIDGKDHTLSETAPKFAITVLKATPEVATEFVTKGWMIPVKVKDNVDNDGDGAEDYEKIIRLINYTANDISAAMSIMSEDGRSQALVAIIDGFKEELDEIYAGTDDDELSEKAGRKHSKETLTALAGLRAKVKAIDEEIATISGEEVEEKATVIETPVEGEPAAEVTKTDEPVAEHKAGLDSATGAGFAREDIAGASPKAEAAVKSGEAISPPPGPTLDEIVAAVKAGITMPPDNTVLLTTLSANLEHLSTRLESVEQTTSAVTQKAAANEQMLSAAIGKAMEPSASGGIATQLENGKIVSPEGQEVHKAKPAVKLDPSMSVMDAALALQKQHR